MVTYESIPYIYTRQDPQETVHPLGDHKGTLKTEYDDITMKTNLNSKQFGATVGTLRFVQKSFSHIFLKFEPYLE